MNSRVVKFVAGGGKTSHATEYMKIHNNGLYLAFTNSVANDMKNSGYLGMTVDSLLFSFLLPKLLSHLPIAAPGAKIELTTGSEERKYIVALNASRIRIDPDGKLSNRNSPITNATLATPHLLLHRSSFANSEALKYIFSKDALRLSHLHVSGLADFFIKNHGELILEILRKRFAYIIIDESQDLNSHTENLAKLLHNSDIPTLLFGDDNQNINNGGKWFESLTPDETRTTTYRCAEGVCAWIRQNLSIEIKGTSSHGVYSKVSLNKIAELDDGTRKLLYNARSGKFKEVIDNWQGPKGTIKLSKGETVHGDVVIVGDNLNSRNLYTAATRATRNVYSTIKPPRVR